MSVGERYERKEFFLPQLLAAAEAMRAGFARLEPLLTATAGAAKARIVMATVEGDIHDIGKNIVCLMLKNHGFEVIDLGKDVPVEKALDLVFGYAVGVDMTRRDLQNAAKDKGQPWDSAKGFDASAPISAIRPWTGEPPQGRITISVNGQIRQDATVADMIWNVAEIISEASKLWTLAPGDLIYTGTPEGVGPLVRGDRVEGEVADVGQLAFKVV